MSKVFICVLVLTFAVISAASAQQQALVEDWESGINGGAGYSGVNQVTNGTGSWFALTGASLNSPTVVNDAVTNLLEEGNHALKTFSASSTALAGQAVFNLGATSNKNFKLEWDWYTEAPATGNDWQREFASTYSYAVIGVVSAGLNQAEMLGYYNTVFTGHLNEYQFRIVNGGGVQAGDVPYQTPAATWGYSNLDKVAPAWHHLAIEQSFTGANSYATVKMYVDDANPIIWKTTSVFGINQVRMGSNLGTSAPAGNGTGYGAYYDNIVLTIPEPGSMLALGTGLIGLLGLVRRRRA